jgi:cell division protein FtsW (lipid II flippase)
MSQPGITKLVSVSALGLLAVIFGLILLSVLSPTLRPTHTDFVFAISRRTLNVGVLTLSVILAALIFFFARALRRRNLN